MMNDTLLSENSIDPEGRTKISIHAATNLIEPRDFSIENKSFDSLKVSFSEMEYKIIEGILAILTKSDYNGLIDPVNVENMVQEGRISLQDTKMIDGLSKLPRLRVRKEDVYRWGTNKKNDINGRERAISALKKISEKSFCISYERLKTDLNNDPVRHSDGSFMKELVSYNSTLFSYAEVEDEDGRNAYIEIIPSPVFLDQIDKYFVMIPNNWRDDVKRVMGHKRIASSVYRFLFALYVQYEIKRRKKKEFLVKWSSEKICDVIQISKTYIKRKKKYFFEVVEKCISTAKECGYVEEYEFDGTHHLIKLAPGHYYDPSRNSLSDQSDLKTLPNRSHLINQFYDILNQEGIKKRKPVGMNKSRGEAILGKLVMNGYSAKEIFSVFKWSLKHKFWASHVLTPQKFFNKFDEVRLDMKNNSSSVLQSPKEFCLRIKEQVCAILKEKNLYFEVLNKYVEIGHRSGGASSQPTCIEYLDKSFFDKLEVAFGNIGISMDSIGE